VYLYCIEMCADHITTCASKNFTKKAIITREFLWRTQATRGRSLHTIYRVACRPTHPLNDADSNYIIIIYYVIRAWSPPAWACLSNNFQSFPKCLFGHEQFILRRGKSFTDNKYMLQDRFSKFGHSVFFNFVCDFVIMY